MACPPSHTIIGYNVSTNEDAGDPRVPTLLVVACLERARSRWGVAFSNASQLEACYHYGGEVFALGGACQALGEGRGMALFLAASRCLPDRQ
jgi:hypothetical protein